MAFTRKRRRFTKKRRFTRKRGRRGVKAVVKRMISRAEETKWISASPGVITVAQDAYGLGNLSTSTLLLNGVPQGTQRFARLGSKTREMSLLLNFIIRGQLNFIYSSAVAIRLLLVRFRDTITAAAPAQSDFGAIFASGAGGLAGWQNDLYNRNNVPAKYKILWDRRFTLGKILAYSATAVPNENVKLIRKRFKLNKTMNWNDLSAGDQTAMVDGALYLMMVTEVATSASGGIGVQCFSELTYKDA